jgi:hypothetical protein
VETPTLSLKLLTPHTKKRLLLLGQRFFQTGRTLRSSRASQQLVWSVSNKSRFTDSTTNNHRMQHLTSFGYSQTCGVLVPVGFMERVTPGPVTSLVGVTVHYLPEVTRYPKWRPQKPMILNHVGFSVTNACFSMHTIQNYIYREISLISRLCCVRKTIDCDEFFSFRPPRKEDGNVIQPVPTFRCKRTTNTIPPGLGAYRHPRLTVRRGGLRKQWNHQQLLACIVPLLFGTNDT